MDDLDYAYNLHRANRMMELKIEIDALKEQYEELKEEVSQDENLELGENIFGDVIIVKSPNPVMNKERALRIYGDLVKARTFNTETARKNLTKSEYRALYDYNDPKVSLKAVKVDDDDIL